MTKQCLTKKNWKNAVCVNPKATRLNLQADDDELFFCFVIFIFVST